MTMSASYFNLLKYAATGIASPSMSYYDRMRASTLMGGATVQTLTGQPPLTFKADGTPLISWSMKGNGSQTGTPTPDNPVMPTFCGVRTSNLFDAATAYGNLYNNGVVSGATAYVCLVTNYFTDEQIGKQITITIKADKVTATRIYITATVSGTQYSSNSIYENNTGIMQITVTPQSTSDYWKMSYGSNANKECIISNLMLNSGSTALPYEPFGYKIPINCAGQTIPIYLGQTQTVRRIKKLVLTGEENITSSHTDVGLFNIPITDYLKIINVVTNICSHYQAGINVNGWSDVTDLTCRFYGNAGSQSKLLYIRNSSFSTVAGFKSYLAQQYANGTPVTIWYVLETEQTAIVNEPLAKIGDYADELSSTDAGVTIPTAKGQNTLTVETELQPSEMTITYKG